ncbi:MAG: FecR domain-containing protein [Bacteroidales bacterium]|nr:FecR domain-containing protein [Bacteroidales bacterium]
MKTDEPETRSNWWKYAATAVIFTMLGSFLYYYFSNLPTPVKLTYQEIFVPYGSTSRIILPDGSSVWLNAGSFLKYNNNYNVTNRNVFVKGEAFFEVEKNGELNFVVTTPGMEVKAVGTKFNVKAYPEEKTVTAAVVEGKIEVQSLMQSGKKSGELLLSSNQAVSLEKEYTEPPLSDPQKIRTGKEKEIINQINPSKILRIENQINVESLIMWRNGILIIERENWVHSQSNSNEGIMLKYNSWMKVLKITYLAES